MCILEPRQLFTHVLKSVRANEGKLHDTATNNIANASFTARSFPG